MANNYDSYIEVAPGYDSVVKIEDDTENRDFWRGYVVNDYMVKAVETISKSLCGEIIDDIRHFFIKGQYGTGKTYSAIVIKHLLEDDYKDVENFLNGNSLFAGVRSDFLSRRKKGPYYVKYRYGECLQLNSPSKFLLQIELSVRDILKENGFTYFGQESIIDSIISKTKTLSPSLREMYDDEDMRALYFSQTASFDEFLEAVEARDVTACALAQEILTNEFNVGFAPDLDTFKSWLKDVFNGKGNEKLKVTGIFIIWDEFTDYIKENDITLIQSLSEFSHEVPFYMIYVIHEYPGVFSDYVNGALQKVNDRFHNIDISLDKGTTYKLIGQNINVKSGMDSLWSDVCKSLRSSIDSDLYYFMGSPDAGRDLREITGIFPFHPMTVELVTMVAGLAASNRSIFAFLKSEGSNGFGDFILHNGPYDGWKWVTPDYLWDYFYIDNREGKELTESGRRALANYNKYRNSVESNDDLHRVFKAVMLLIATAGSGGSYRKTRGATGLQTTDDTIYHCFAGAIDKKDVAKYLHLLNDEIGCIRLGAAHGGISFIELPFSGTPGDFDKEMEALKASDPPTSLFKSENCFGKEVCTRFVPDGMVSCKRLEVRSCWSSKTQIKSTFSELSDLLDKAKYKFGMVIVSAPSDEEVNAATNYISEILSEHYDDCGKRLTGIVLHHTLSEDRLEDWYRLKANASLAAKSSSPENSKAYQDEADFNMSELVETAISKGATVLYGTARFEVSTNTQALRRYEDILSGVFPAAPEIIAKKGTLFKSSSETIAYYGVKMVSLKTKDPIDDKQKNFNQQWQDCVYILSDGEEDVWNCKDITDIIGMGKTPVGGAMSSLCTFVEKKMEQDVISLDDMWDGLQSELGYYNTAICCYLLGFVFHFYVGKYTWSDGVNSRVLDADTASKTVYEMVSGKSAGKKLSSESDSQKRCKEISKGIFGLSEDETGDIYRCLKSVRGHISGSGYPFWALKYLDDEDYGDLKDDFKGLVDEYERFVLSSIDVIDNNIINSIVESYRKHAVHYRKLIPALYKNSEKLKYGMNVFMSLNSPKLVELEKSYGFDFDEVYMMLKTKLNEDIWLWTEEKVKNALAELTLDIELVGLVNIHMGRKAVSVEKTQKNLENRLSNVLVPRCVYRQLDDEWVETLDTLNKISKNEWGNFSSKEKESAIHDLKNHMEDAYKNIVDPTYALKTYIEKNKFGSFSSDEYGYICEKLLPESYEQNEKSFKDKISHIIDELEYTKLRDSILIAWNEKTSTEDVADWVAKYKMPIEWAMPGERDVFNTVSSIKEKRRVDFEVMKAVLDRIDSCDFVVLSDKENLDRIFVTNVSSERFINILLPHIDDLKGKIRQSGRDFEDYGSWSGRLNDIRKLVNKYVSDDLKGEVSEQVRRKIENMPVDRLKDEIGRIVDQCPEAGILLLKEDDD